MKIEVNPRNAMRIYLVVLLMLLAGFCFGTVALYRHFSGSGSAQIAPRGEISVVVQEVQNSTPTANTSASTPAATTTNAEQGSVVEESGLFATAWAWTWRIGILFLFLCLAGLTVEYFIYRLIIKSDPMPELKEYWFKPWKVPGWTWKKCRWNNDGDEDEKKKTSPTPDAKKKSKGGWGPVIGVLFKWGLALVVFSIVFTTITQPRSMLVLIQQFSRSITGETFPVVDRMLVETAPDQNEIQRGLPPEQQNPRVMSWIATERLPSSAGLIATAPRSFKTDYIMSDEIAFQIHMKDTTSNGEIIILLRHNRSGELYGWWERVGGPKLDMVVTKPSWRADRMPDGSFYLRLQDEKIPALFEELRIYKK